MSLPYVKNSDTSKAAAEQMEDRAPSQEARILALMDSDPLYQTLGITKGDVMDKLGFSHPSATRAIRMLVQRGVLRDSGLRRLNFNTKAYNTLWKKV